MKGVVWFFIVFFAFAAVVHVIIYVLYDQLVKYEESQNVARSALTASSEVHPPEPRLQPTRIWHETTEPEDLALMHGRENLEFVKRGWITGRRRLSRAGRCDQQGRRNGRLGSRHNADKQPRIRWKRRGNGQMSSEMTKEISNPQTLVILSGTPRRTWLGCASRSFAEYRSG